MPRQFSLKQILEATTFLAFALATWTPAGPYVLLCVLLISAILIAASFSSSFDSHRQSTRRYAQFSLAVVLILLLSLGPACGLYSRYDPGFWSTPTVRRLFCAFYAPVGQCYAFSLWNLNEFWIAYLRLWVPDETTVEALGSAVAIRSNGGALYVGR